MPVFKYTAKAAPGETVSGEMHAENVTALSARLHEMGLFALEVTPVRNGRAARPHGPMALFRKSVPNKSALVVFTRQLASMLEAGLTLHTAIQLSQKQAEPGPMQEILRDLAERLRDGYRFSDACAAWPKIFSEFYINMIKAGEAGGMLELVLDHLADFLEKEDNVQKQIQAALAYPVLMLGMGLLTVVLLLTFVVPRLVAMFQEIGQSLPLPTRILIAISGFLSHYWQYLLPAMIAIGLAVRNRYTQPGFRESLDRQKLALPFFGKLIVQGEVAQFARTLGALLGHGVPIQRAFEVVIAACKNTVLRAQFQRAADSIRAGRRIGASLLECQGLPTMLGQMVGIAEETNQLELVLGRIAKSGAQEVERRVAIFTRLLEPIMIIAVGAVIGFIVFAMMMPIFQMNFAVQ